MIETTEWMQRAGGEAGSFAMALMGEGEGGQESHGDGGNAEQVLTCHGQRLPHGLRRGTLI